MSTTWNSIRKQASVRLLLLTVLSLTNCGNLYAQVTPEKLKLGSFCAFYTRIDSIEEFERYSRTGEYADIVVDLGDGSSKFVFRRGSSYLPYFENDRGKWYVDELIPRKGNGEGIMPDRINAYSHVAVIENSAGKVVVHWRYLPMFSGMNPHTGVNAAGFVDEYFTITPEARVERTIRKGTSKIDNWFDPGNRIVHAFVLSPSGIQKVETRNPVQSVSEEPVVGAKRVTGIVVDPVAWWRFDEASGDRAPDISPCW